MKKLFHTLLNCLFWAFFLFLYGLDPDIAPGSTRVYGGIRETRVYISPVLFSLCARVFPTNRGKVGPIMCSLTQKIHFLSYQIFGFL